MNNSLGNRHMNSLFTAALSPSMPCRSRRSDSVWQRLLAASLLATLLGLAGCGESTTKSDEQQVAHEGEPGHTEGDEHESSEPQDGHGEHFQLSAQAREAAGLAIAIAGPAMLKETVSLYGTVKPNAERVRNVGARFPGVVRSVKVRIGDSVAQGATLAVVESNESLQEYAVRSPLDGVITDRLTNPGEQAETRPLFTVADLSSLWVELALYPRDRAKVRPGQNVRVQTTDGGLSGEGKIVFVSPLGTTQTQSLTARVLLDNRDGRWSPGLYVRGEVAVSEVSVPLTVPAVALQELEGRVSVFVDEGKALDARPVKIGRNDGNVVEILAGLTEGETVVGDGSFVLKAEMGKGKAEHDH